MTQYRKPLSCIFFVVAGAYGCGEGVGGDSANQTDVALGGRLYDKWYAETSLTVFVPNQGVGTGVGGPNGNGTLNDGNGQILLHNGTNYRFKEYFGWDLRGGQDGIYGLLGKVNTLSENLLTGSMGRNDLIARFTWGDDQLPGWGAVMSTREIASVVDFILGVRNGSLVGPNDIYRLDLSANNPKKYVLVEGGSAAAGRIAVASSCAAGGCHGSDGTAIDIDNGYSLGSFARSHAYEVMWKTLNGQPDSFMGPQLSQRSTVQEQIGYIRNVLAALCDASRFPATTKSTDGDAIRCGSNYVAGP